MNTVSINNAIVKKFGLEKSKCVEGKAQLLNRQNICYAYTKTYKYVGDFHCQKYYGNTYHFYTDNTNNVTLETVNKIAEFLIELGCETFATGMYGFSFRIPKNK